MTSDLVFISYARDDAEAAGRLYHDLRKLGLQPWLDRESLRAGEKWRPAISTAIEGSRFFVALISSRSVSRRGYLHKEVAEALEVLDQLPESESFLIPSTPRRLRAPASRITRFELGRHVSKLVAGSQETAYNSCGRRDAGNGNDQRDLWLEDNAKRDRTCDSPLHVSGR